MAATSAYAPWVLLRPYERCGCSFLVITSARADSGVIVIQEMVSAGTAALEAYSGSFSYSTLVAAVYSAMGALDPFSEPQCAREEEEEDEKKD